jgi:hypothetical protein
MCHLDDCLLVGLVRASAMVLRTNAAVTDDVEALAALDHLQRDRVLAVKRAVPMRSSNVRLICATSPSVTTRSPFTLIGEAVYRAFPRTWGS